MSLQPVRTNLVDFSGWIVDRWRRELTLQGHVVTGALLESIDFEIVEEGNELKILFYNLDYGEDLETGLRADQIPSGPAATARIKDLAVWVSRRGMAFDRNEIRKVAFFVHRSHTRVGMPTPNSYQYSDVGRRIGWRTYVLETDKSEIQNRIEDAITRGFIKTLISIFQSVIKTNLVYVRSN